MDIEEHVVLVPKSNKGLVLTQTLLAAYGSFATSALAAGWFGPHVGAIMFGVSSATNAGLAAYVAAAKPVASLQAPPRASG